MSDSAIAPATCTVSGNPDIAGIGVRSAIYAQNILCFLLALWALWDGNVTVEELEHAEMQITTNLVLAFAILISSIVQALTYGISSYHGQIVLMLSWMNNTNAFVYFILYLHHRIGLPEGQGRVAASWRAWWNHVMECATQSFRIVHKHRNGSDTEYEAVWGGSTNVDDSPKRKGSALIKRVAFVLGSLHLTLMSVLGIWVWSDPKAFGLGREEPNVFKAANQCTIDLAVLSVLGQQLPVSLPALRAISLFIYSLFLIPGVNVVVPMVMLFATYLLCRKLPFSKGWEVLPAYIGLDILLGLNVVFIVDIELTLNLNLRSGMADRDENTWGFGQILAILLLLLPMRDLVEAILSRRMKRRQNELDEDAKEAIANEDFNAVRRAIERGSAFPSPKLSPDEHSIFWTLVVKNGALDHFNDLRRARMTTPEKALEGDLQLALQKKDLLQINALYHQGADLIAGVLHSPKAITLVFWQALDNGYSSIAKFYAQLPGPHVKERRGRSPLVLAAERGCEVLVQHLLENPFTNVTLPKADPLRHTALILASQNGHEGVVKLLLSHKDVDVNETNRVGETALMHASAPAVAQALLTRHDIQVNARDAMGKTALMHALSNGSEDLAHTLLNQNDIRVNEADNWGQTALIYASRFGCEALLKRLRDRDDVLINAGDNRGRNALMEAAGLGREATVRALSTHPNILLNTADKEGRTPLIHASVTGQAKVVEILIEQGDIDINTPDNKGKTALMHALEQGHHATAKILLEHKRVDHNAVDSNGKSALMYASEGGNHSAAEILLQRPDLQVNAKDSRGSTALMKASGFGYAGIAKMLLARADTQVNLTDNDGGTALVHAVIVGECLGRCQEDIVRLLVSRDDVQVNLPSLRNGATPLMFASANGMTAKAKCLLERPDIQINLVDNEGNTALMIAVKKGHKDIVELLLARSDIELDIENKAGNTAYTLAMYESPDTRVGMVVSGMIARCLAHEPRKCTPMSGSANLC